MSTESEVRGSKLAERVEELEKLMRSGAAVPGTSLASLLDTAQAQRDANRAEDEQQVKLKEEKERKDRSAIAAMVERETKLSKEEKEKYAGFLAKDYFTRSDLGDLSRFYADGGAYDRLSESGKEQMDNRVKEGVRRGELPRDDLPPQIEKKAYRGEKSQESSRAKSEVDGTTASLSADERAKAVANAASKVERREPDSEASASKENSKRELPAGLDGLANLSPVQETSGVVVPQTGVKSGPRELGG